MNLNDLIYESKYIPKDCFLTIAIPTYKRKDNLMVLLAHIAPCLGGRTCVLISDNDPETVISDVECDLLQIGVPIKYYKNKFNLSADTNILRALECADTEWVYLLGDSKLPCKDVLSKLEDICLNNPNASGLVFDHYKLINEPLIARSIMDIKDKKFNLGSMFFVGNSVYHRRSIERNIRAATEYTITRMPHGVIHLLELKRGANIVFLNYSIIEIFLQKPTVTGAEMTLMECWSQFGLILNLPLSPNELKIINRKVLQLENKTTIINFIKYCIIQSIRNKFDLRPYLKRLIRNRYPFIFISLEKLLILGLYGISQIICFGQTRVKDIEAF